MVQAENDFVRLSADEVRGLYRPFARVSSSGESSCLVQVLAKLAVALSRAHVRLGAGKAATRFFARAALGTDLFPPRRYT